VELGNSNRCVAQEECPDVCKLPPSPGPCRAAIPRYFHNSTSGQCEQFIYGGCRGNDNNFETEESCNAQCISELSPIFVGYIGLMLMQTHLEELCIPEVIKVATVGVYICALTTCCGSYRPFHHLIHTLASSPSLTDTVRKGSTSFHKVYAIFAL